MSSSDVPSAPVPALLRPAAIDVHAHFVTPRYRASALTHGAGQPDGLPALPEWGPSAALKVMDDVGIAAALLSLSSPGTTFVSDPAERAELAAAINEDGAAIVAAHPDRFGLLATLPLPDVEAAVAGISHALDECHADGIGMLTHTDGVYLGDALLDPVLAALDERAAVVAIHPTSPCGWEQVSFGRPRSIVEFPLDTTRAVINLALSGAFTRFPRIRWIVPHAGAALAVLVDRVDLFSRSITPTDPPVDLLHELGRLHYDLAGVPLPRALPALLGLVKVSQLLYGSDFPFTPAGRVHHLALALQETDHLTSSARTAVLHANAARLFPRLQTGDSPSA